MPDVAYIDGHRQDNLVRIIQKETELIADYPFGNKEIHILEVLVYLIEENNDLKRKITELENKQ